jgi:hypothetical protein
MGLITGRADPVSPEAFVVSLKPSLVYGYD